MLVLRFQAFGSFGRKGWSIVFDERKKIAEARKQFGQFRGAGELLDTGWTLLRGRFESAVELFLKSGEPPIEAQHFGCEWVSVRELLGPMNAPLPGGVHRGDYQRRFEWSAIPFALTPPSNGSIVRGIFLEPQACDHRFDRALMFF